MAPRGPGILSRGRVLHQVQVQGGSGGWGLGAGRAGPECEQVGHVRGQQWVTAGATHTPAGPVPLTPVCSLALLL